MAITIKAKPRQGPGARPVHLTRVDLKHIGPFPSLTFAPEALPDASKGQWVVLLGANGTGKSTLLRAIALALEGHRSADMYLSIFDRPFVRGPANGVIEVTRGSTTHSLEIAAGPPDLPTKGDPNPHHVDVFGYGATRGTALGGSDREVQIGRHRVSTTLFSSHDRLIHAETWLRRQALRNKKSFIALLETLASLLPDGERLKLVGDQLRVTDRNGHEVAFESMSDGYLTTLGWTIDLIAQWSNKYRDDGHEHVRTDDMPCIVLVDELDLHLHPKWQLDIIPRLRAAFPKTTFVVTTHNPLTLHGARAGEVFVLERDAAGKVGITQRDITPGLDANRILTDWFGLPTTLDNDTRDLMAEHLKLLWQKVPPTNPHRRALEQTLRDRLGRYADTSLERIAQSVVAEVLHRKAGGPLADITPTDRSEIVAQFESEIDALDAPAPTSTARESGPTWRRSPKKRSAPAKAKTKTKTKTKIATRKTRAKR